MKRFFLTFFVFSLMSLLVNIFVIGDNANAVVPPENDFKPYSGTLIQKGGSAGTPTCEENEHYFNIGSTLNESAPYQFLDNEDSEFHYTKSWNYTNNSTGARVYMDTFADDWQIAVQNPEEWSWAFFQVNSPSGWGNENASTIVFLLAPRSTEYTLSERLEEPVTDGNYYRLTPSDNNVRALAFNWNANAGCRWQSVLPSISGTAFTPRGWTLNSSSDVSGSVNIAGITFGIFNFTINNPDDLPATLPPIEQPNIENLKPEIAYTVNEEGLLTWQYMNNLRPFLTGVFYTNIDTLNNDWSLDTTLTTVTSQPAGWLNEQYTLPSAGRYMLYITHNQQLDDPPWTNQDFFITPVALQFEWDGKSFLSGSNVNCDALELCNPFNQTDPTKQGLFSSLNLPTYGLDQAVKAPLAFLSSLPAKLASNACTPLVLPIPYLSEDLELPCMRPIYETHFPLIYNLWSTIVVALFSYGMAINLFARIKKDVNPKDDSIEAVKL